MSDVKIFGADGCEDTHATRVHLDGLGIGYDYINNLFLSCPRNS
jgi:glutaredoxin-related protein